MNFDNGSASIGPSTVGYRLEGDGPRHVVLLHGLNSHSGTWRKTIPALLGSCTVLAPSLPANRGPGTESLAEEYAAVVGALIEKLGLRHTVTVGNSMGGLAGMKLALSGEGLVSRLMLEDSAGAHSQDPLVLARAHQPISIVWGEGDRVIPLSVGRMLHAKIPGSELHVVRGAEHVPHWEQPEEFNRLLSAFVRG